MSRIAIYFVDDATYLENFTFPPAINMHGQRISMSVTNHDRDYNMLITLCSGEGIHFEMLYG